MCIFNYIKLCELNIKRKRKSEKRETVGIPQAVACKRTNDTLREHPMPLGFGNDIPIYGKWRKLPLGSLRMLHRAYPLVTWLLPLNINCISANFTRKGEYIHA